MRFLSVFFASVVAVMAQSPLTTTFANSFTFGRVVYFDLEALDPNGVTITQLDLSVAGFGGVVIDVYLAPETFAPHTQAWIGPVSSSFVGVPNPSGTPTNFVLNPPLELGPGCKFGVALVHSGAFVNVSPGAGLPSTYATAELELTMGATASIPFQGTAFEPRLVNTRINYTSGGTCPELALVASQGAGCVESYASFHETLSASSMDLNGMTLTATRTTDGYMISTANGTANAIGSLGPAASLPLGDDEVLPAGTLGLEVSSNGQVFDGPGGGGGFTPSVPQMLGSTPASYSFWTDMQPNAIGSGLVWYEEAGTVAQVTFDGVYGWQTTDRNFIQFVIDTATGDFSMTFGATGAGNPEDFVIGYSPAGPSEDPGPVDISAGPFTTSTDDNIPLVLGATGRPIQGAVTSPFQCTTSNIPSTALLHLTLIGLSRPAVPLAAIGMPGCFLNASTDVIRLDSFSPSAPPASFTFTALTLPAGAPFLSGFQFNVQSAILGTGLNNLIGLGSLTSNGLKCTVGTQ